MNARTQQRCNIFLLCSGLFLIFSSLSIHFLSQYIIQTQVSQNVVIKPNSTAYGYWTNPPANIVRKYYLFDLVNSNEVERGEKPIFRERGPYAYKEIWEKRNVEFLNGTMIKYTPVSTLYFVPELSNGTEDDILTFLNVPAYGLISYASSQSRQVQKVSNFLLKVMGSKIFYKKTVREYINGYEDPLLKLAKAFLPDMVKSEIFTITNGRNGTEWQNFTMLNGESNTRLVGDIVNWNGLEKLNYWSNEYANMINGTDGTTYPPFRKRDEKVYSYNADMCRSYYLNYYKDDVVNDVNVYTFRLPVNIFDNTTLNPENEGFFEGEYLGNGVQNITKCYNGPGFISKPHFLDADQTFLNNVRGLSPDREKHEFRLHFEPITGVAIGGNVRLQINFFIKPAKNFEIAKKIKPVLFPVVWFDDEFVLEKDIVAQLRFVATLVNVIKISVIVILSLGSFNIFSAGVIFIYLARTKRKDEIKMPISEDCSSSSLLNSNLSDKSSDTSSKA